MRIDLTKQRIIFSLFFSVFVLYSGNMYSQHIKSDSVLSKLIEMPLKNIFVEYPNKPGHTYVSADEVRLSPRDLHPVFYGCFDWHSSVHGHWMLVRLLRNYPNSKLNDKIIQTLNASLNKENIEKEAAYFDRSDLAKSFERTYGWAWVLKLDEELYLLNTEEGKKWHKNLQPLTKKIVELWKAYLPKQSYPTRVGTHNNSAFALGFAIDWARTVKDKDFESALIEKAKAFYLDEKDTPSYLEPDGTDFFSPSLLIADLMARVLPDQQYDSWFDLFISSRGVKNLCESPTVSDLNDYQIVHLVGLSFSRSWCMRTIAEKMQEGNPYKKLFTEKSIELFQTGISQIFLSNYGGDHWLATFAIYAD